MSLKQGFFSSFAICNNDITNINVCADSMLGHYFYV